MGFGMRQEIGTGTVLPAGGVSGWQKQREQRVVKRDMSWIYLGVSEKNGTPKSSILVGFSIIFTIHFGVPLFLETPIWMIMKYILHPNISLYCGEVISKGG